MKLKTKPKAKKAAASKSSAPKAKATKRVYFFGAGKAEGGVQLKDLLGGKGANLADMTLAKLPVPPGFTITTQTCKEYNDLGQKLPRGLMDEVRATLPRPKRPAARSSAMCESAARGGSLRSQGLDAGHDGYGAQHRPQ